MSFDYEKYEMDCKKIRKENELFLGYWFIKKAMWSSPVQIKSNAASLKKFFTFN